MLQMGINLGVDLGLDRVVLKVQSVKFSTNWFRLSSWLYCVDDLCIMLRFNQWEVVVLVVHRPVNKAVLALAQYVVTLDDMRVLSVCI